MSCVPGAVPAPGRLAQSLGSALSAAAAAGCALAAMRGGAWTAAGLAGGLGLMASWLMTRCRTGQHPRLREALADFLVPALLALAADPGLHIWEIPASFAGVLRLTGLAAATGCLAHLVLVFSSVSYRRCHPLALASLCVLAVPFLFNWLLLLANPGLVERLGRIACLGLGGSPALLAFAGRLLNLLLLNELVVLAMSLLLSGRPATRPRIHLALALGALAAAVTPPVADWGSTAQLASWHILPATAAAIAATMLSQAGLWAETFLVTGILLDALHGKTPSTFWVTEHLASGFKKGAVYSGVFMAVVHVGDLLAGADAIRAAIVGNSFLSCALFGALAFPLAKTILETFDGSPAFFPRLAYSAKDPAHYARGMVMGVGVGMALLAAVQSADPGIRFVYGCAVGAAAYAGVDLLRDMVLVAARRRGSLQTWKLYALGLCLGAFCGGALAWYLDTAQLAVIAAKYAKYAALHFPAKGIQIEDYVIYPLFNKWGAMPLGQPAGGVRLFYAEAVSGVINWSLAAPLFSVNLVLLTALLKRSTRPLKDLFTRQGAVGLVEQAVRVLRWGLWMAPIIYSFLRMSPDPAWYNQDGALRTLAAMYQSMALDPGAFRAWSLNLFLLMLVHDWLRIAIWLDHMGLRVATLVNLSFVGVDILDEKAARLVGHSARTRHIPEGLRRFATWAPLLIPFYLPRGKDWDYAWGRMEALRASAGPDLPWTPAQVAVGILALGLAAALVSALRRRPPQAVDHRQPAVPAGSAPCPAGAPCILQNGVYVLSICDDGAGYSRAVSAERPGEELDLTRRPDDRLHLTGKFFYLTDPAAPAGKEDDPDRSWSLGWAPMRRVGPDYASSRPDRASFAFGHTYRGIRAEAKVAVPADDPVEVWTVRLTNPSPEPRQVVLTSYREPVLHAPDAYRRHPSFTTLHLGTTFVRPLAAILARNRLLKYGRKHPRKGKPCHEVAFHAVREEAGVRLAAYEDSRSHFIGNSTLRNPEGLSLPLRKLSDEGLLYSFDPAACLRVEVDLPAGRSVEVRFVDGYARTEERAAELIACHLGITAPALNWKALEKPRMLHGFGAPGDAAPAPAPRFEFSPGGDELVLHTDTPRPWAHVLANQQGFGTVLTNAGAMFSFMANAQQNALTPFCLESLTAQHPGQLIYLVDQASGRTTTPTHVPYREPGARRREVFGLGFATFHKELGEIETELTVFVVPDQPLEVKLLTVRNRGRRPLTLRVVAYAEMVLGELALDTRGKLLARQVPGLEALFFTNPENDFHKGQAFVAMSLPADATETVRSRVVGGPDRDLSNPYLAEFGESDPTQPDDGARVAALVGTLHVPPDGEESMSLIMGQARHMETAEALVREYRPLPAAFAALVRTRRYWAETLGVLRVQSDRPEFDRLVNFWLPYQLLTARLWGRTGPNQRSGAFGFRDQLQDVLPLIPLRPELARKQILLHAAQQFPEGDIMQWWHQSWENKTGLGMRNYASDPHLWLPYLVVHYLRGTGDYKILDEIIPFLEGKPIPRGQEGYVFAPRPSKDADTLYGHCLRAVNLTLRRCGSHGLPRMGTGDWNDGLSAVGPKKKGESVWLGFFLYHVLTGFADLAGRKEGEAARERLLRKAHSLRRALSSMLRGKRFVRAVMDSGKEMLFADALTSSWSAISGATDFETALAAVEDGLAELEKENLVLLLSPAFDENSAPYPGRIAEYPPGVRENGGQYSHGSSWLVDALVKLGDEAAAADWKDETDRLRSRALAVWTKISPLAHCTPEEIVRYGLPPHQQPAGIAYGPGYEARGGWAWYTGAAARMLFAAYALLGLRLEHGRLALAPDFFSPDRPLKVERLFYKGEEYKPGKG
jgi:cyclic beta-1,2-glucan synthetase